MVTRSANCNAARASANEHLIRLRYLQSGCSQHTTDEVDTHRINAYTWIVSGSPDLYFISVAARMLGMHPQTLRKYERLGLVQPTRTIGSMRIYSHDELERLKLIKRLVDDSGINLAGVQRLLSIAEVVQRLRPLMRDDALAARDTRRRVVQELDELSRMLGFD